MPIDSKTFEHLLTWIGRCQSGEDVITPAPIAALAATLDHTEYPVEPGAALPPLWHWLYFLPLARQSELGSDGHPARGGFLPPVDLPRRMWAGSRLAFGRPLVIGERVHRQSTITDVRHKQGRSGDLVFVSVRHELAGHGGGAIVEDQQIVYRAAGAATAAAPAIPEQRDAEWQRIVHPDPVLLFRYSALTFNGHRIHYDRSYATQVEGYPGLVVHGPLIATLLIDGLREACPGRSVTHFEFRAQRPLFDTASFSVAGKTGPDALTCSLWAMDREGMLAMDAKATLSE